MRNIMARSPHESSFSFSKRHFQCIIGKFNGGGEGEDDTETLTFSTTVSTAAKERKNKSSKFLSVLTSAFAGRRSLLGPRVIGTMFGHRRGHIHFAFQADSKLSPAVLIELAMPTSTLVREMASGLVRIALECERKGASGGRGRLLEEETLWRAYCNGKKFGYAVRRECGPSDWRVLKAVEPVSMGAGVLPAVDGSAGGGGGEEGEMMYMRAKFERVVGSKDSEAFYMRNPDGNGGPELSIYLLRV